MELDYRVGMVKRAERVKREIKTIFKPEAEKPSNVAKEHTNLYIKACKVFGSWRNAVEACGIDYESTRNNKKWNREKIHKEIKRLKKKGYNLRPSVLREEGMTTLISAAEYHFGSWRRAVESCGFEYTCGRNRKPGNGYYENGRKCHSVLRNQQ
ncbi:MAG: hypothetical protein RIG61_04520 [Deltaproteobacteria bacterium]